MGIRKSLDKRTTETQKLTGTHDWDYKKVWIKQVRKKWLNQDYIIQKKRFWAIQRQLEKQEVEATV